MKYIKLKLFLIQLLFITTLQISFAQEKRALIIAVGNYDRAKTFWNPISSANDIPLIMNALTQQGFQESNITILADSLATKSGIISAIEMLTEKTNENDVVFVHYSGHGQQIQDDNGDEIDGYDESLIPINASMRFKRGIYNGENHFRDDELGNYLSRLRKKAGQKGNVFVVIDACHSGTSTRGEGKARGTFVRFEDPEYKPIITNDTDNRFESFTEEDGIAPIVCFYGAAAHQLNFEYKETDTTSYGSLSYAFSKALSNTKSTTSYKALFEQVKLTMATIAPRQIPQAEGTLNQTILGGAILGIPDYALVSEYVDTKNVVINKGMLHNFNVDSKVGFYTADVRDYQNAVPIATGTVKYADISTADIELDKELSKEIALSSWVYITEQNFGNMTLRVKCAVKNPVLMEALNKAIDKAPIIRIDKKNYDVTIEEINDSNKGKALLITTIDDKEILNLPINDEKEDKLSNEIITRLKEYSQSRFIRSLSSENNNLNVKFEIIPINAQQTGRRVIEISEIPILEKTDGSGNLVFKEGDYFKLKITNKGSVGFYFSLIDIQPDDKINLLLPPANRTSQEFRLESYQQYVSPPIRLAPPFGNEVFKLVVSESPIELGQIISSRGEEFGSKGTTTNPFQVLFSESYKSELSTRGPEMPNLPAGAVKIETLLFEISPKDSQPD